MAKKIIKIGSEHYILATSALADSRTRVLKQGETFAIFNRYGDVQRLGLGEQGLYHQGTRFLSRCELNLGSTHPFLLSSMVSQDNTVLSVDLTNPDFAVDDVFVPRGSLHISRAKLLWDGSCYERLRFTNFSPDPVVVTVSLQFEADFADIFEVRGEERAQRGVFMGARVLDHQAVEFEYVGLDGVRRSTRLTCVPAPQSASSNSMAFEICLNPKEEQVFDLTVSCAVDQDFPAPLSFSSARARSVQALQALEARFCSIYTDNEQFNDWLNRSLMDICLMTTQLPQGPYPYAGIPWFSTVFGRDGLITALECLWINPDLARGVLAVLSATQAETILPERDAEPGKILHEMRRGEMAALHEVPFEQYYGSVDATPLFIILGGAYFERTGDKDFLVSLWPSVQRALEWMDRYGDKDGDGFVEYARQTPEGLAQQGWKDSYDSVFHADGTIAEGPIALCEVQGYVYAAKIAASKLAAVLGDLDRSQELHDQAQRVYEQFNRHFWANDLGTYLLALDGKKHPCRVRTSNAGHALWSGIASEDRAGRVIRGLLHEDFFSGWGIRTLHASEIRYNPMAYHNGSVWPHDNALIALGMSRYGCVDGVLKVLAGLFDMSIHVDLHRLPELICGFARRPGEGPVLYPVACAPQTWAAGAVFALLQACLGLSFDGEKREIRFTNPTLPEFLPAIQIKHLRLGKSSVDVTLMRKEADVLLNVTRKDEDINIVTVKS